jgi:hypothetical protein
MARQDEIRKIPGGAIPVVLNPIRMPNAKGVMKFLLKFEQASPTSVRHLIIRAAFVIHHSGFVPRWPTSPRWHHQD